MDDRPARRSQEEITRRLKSSVFGTKRGSSVFSFFVFFVFNLDPKCKWL